MSGYELITKYTSPNQSPRSVYGHNSEKPTGITIHHWGDPGQQFQNVVDYLCRPGGSSSAHVVAEGGRVAWIVNASQAAWHSGNTIGNGTTIGIELRPEASSTDYVTAAELIRDIRAEYGELPLYPHNHWFNTACPGKWDLPLLNRMVAGLQNPALNAPAKTTDETITPMTPDQAKQLAYIASPQFKIDLWNSKDANETRARNEFFAAYNLHSSVGNFQKRVIDVLSKLSK
jgi:N-acetylmuramoyl-L-alanine amidase